VLKNLAEDDPAIYKQYCAALRYAAAIRKFIHTSGRFPLTNHGRLNLAPLFVETMRTLTAPTGRTGAIVPTGIATDTFNQRLFRDLIDTPSFVSLYDFENREAIFPGVHRSYNFCLLTPTGSERPVDRGVRFLPARDGTVG
jgi:hypothetical protein